MLNHRTSQSAEGVIGNEKAEDASPAASLTPNERLLLQWLSEEDGQYGECYGETLDGLIAKGLATVGGEETGLNNTFIAKGRDIMYRAVSITDAGRAARSAGK